MQRMQSAESTGRQHSTCSIGQQEPRTGSAKLKIPWEDWAWCNSYLRAALQSLSSANLVFLEESSLLTNIYSAFFFFFFFPSAGILLLLIFKKNILPLSAIEIDRVI